MTSKITETIDPYIELKTQGAKTHRLQFNSSNPFTPTWVASNLSQSSDPGGMYASRVKGRNMLLDNPARESKALKALQEKRVRRKAQKERKKLGIVGKREAKEKGVWKFDESQAKFELFLPLHHLWMGYMSELLSLSQKPAVETPASMAKAVPGSAGMHPKLLKADFHGSIMTVRQSKNPCIVGLSGIVIHETENAFRVVTKNDKLKVIPKQNSIFAFAVPLYSTLPPTHTLNTPFPLLPPMTGKATEAGGANDSTTRQTVLDSPHIEFELYGNQFRFRSAERAGRKFKHKETIEL
ncbi:RNase P/MRP p29 subunit [Crassisporium funariophilum]|nr:RNase P/MRP p29 subunit [Crassisporium funariophilum]